MNSLHGCLCNFLHLTWFYFYQRLYLLEMPAWSLWSSDEDNYNTTCFISIWEKNGKTEILSICVFSLDLGFILVWSHYCWSDECIRSQIIS